jgi:hypothetical protein
MTLEIIGISVEIRPNNRPGPVKAYADVRIQTLRGMLCERGYAVIHKDGGTPFVGFPSRPGNIAGKFFPVVEAEGDIRNELFDAILSAYQRSTKQ